MLKTVVRTAAGPDAELVEPNKRTADVMAPCSSTLLTALCTLRSGGTMLMLLLMLLIHLTPEFELVEESN